MVPSLVIFMIVINYSRKEKDVLHTSADAALSTALKQFKPLFIAVVYLSVCLSFFVVLFSAAAFQGE